MKLIRANIEKQRAVFLLRNGLYRKYWYDRSPAWLNDHIVDLKKYVPGYVNSSGCDLESVWIDFNPLPGKLASTFEHTPEFVERIHKFCLENITHTLPYTHGDWALSNMLVDGDTIRMCDWDNLGIRKLDAVLVKLTDDLTDAFGIKFQQYVQQLPDPSAVHHLPNQET